MFIKWPNYSFPKWNWLWKVWICTTDLRPLYIMTNSFYDDLMLQKYYGNMQARSIDENITYLRDFAGKCGSPVHLTDAHHNYNGVCRNSIRKRSNGIRQTAAVIAKCHLSGSVFPACCVRVPSGCVWRAKVTRSDQTSGHNVHFPHVSHLWISKLMDGAKYAFSFSTQVRQLPPSRKKRFPKISDGN